MDKNEKLIIEDLKTGTGKEVKSGDTIIVHYTGMLTNSEKFDSSYDRKQPLDVYKRQPLYGPKILLC